MTTYNQLSNEQRDIIQTLINQKKSFSYISKVIDKDRTTISKEIKRNRYIKSNFYDAFDKKGIQEAVSRCNILSKPPYVCNACFKKTTCIKHHLYYNSSIAHKHYLEVLKSSREGIDTKQEVLDEIEHVIVPLIKNQKQSVNQVFINHKDILSMSKVTFYRYVNQGILSLTNIDLPKKIKYKKRKKKNLNNSYKRDISILEHRRYEDYLDFISKHPKMSKVQLDTVIGKSSNKKVLLTMYLVDTHFMLIFLLDKKTSNHVTEVFKKLKQDLTINLYRKIFRIILTDNGVEFYNPYEMEIDYDTCKKVCNVFYCKPYSSWQKHEIEVNHEYIRRVLPKGSDFSTLTSKQVKKLQDNINAIPRDSLNGKTPFDLTKQKYPDFIKALNCKFIKPDKVSLNIEDILEDK